MQIIRAAAMGMCFGVRRALEMALAEADPAAVTILGELVHNEEVLRELARRGFAILPEAERGRIPSTSRVMITAHGASDRDRRRLTKAGKDIIDTTCPLVRRIHQAAIHLQAQGYFVIVIGKRGHVEVQGITGDLEACEVVDRPEEAREYAAGRLGVVCQSTVTPDAADAILATIRAKNPGKPICYIPTICRPTILRQRAALLLLRQVDALVVVGGRHSNNTLGLVNQARERGVPCLHVQSEEDLAPEWFDGRDIVGLTAGTSTPEATIEAVYRRLLEIANANRHAADSARPADHLREIA